MLKISPNEQQNILECMRRIGVLPESPCNGKGLCGKCKVRIVSGKVSEPTLQEQKLLTQQELSEGVRLACLTLPLEELQIDALDLMSEQNSCVLSAGEMPELNLHPAVALKSIFLEAPTLAKATCLCDPLDRPCTLEALRKLPGYTRKQVVCRLLRTAGAGPSGGRLHLWCGHRYRNHHRCSCACRAVHR